MILLLILFGILTGITAGFFGIGGGMVIIPMLLFAGFSMKHAISISIVQMVFTSTFGSFLNYKKNKSVIKDGLLLGIGGFLGGLFSGLIVIYISSLYLKYLFLFIILLAIYRIAITNTEVEYNKIHHNKYILLIIGLLIGFIAMSIGVGGSVMLTPILVGYMRYNLKDASSLGLFFVVFSSIAGFISLSYTGQMLFFEGFIVAIASLVGVYFGIKIKDIANISSYKKLILVLYISIFISVIIKS